MVHPCFNDLTIKHDCELLRRIPPLHFVRDPKREGGITASSAAFDDDEDGPMSVYLNQVLQREGLPRESVLDGHPYFSLMSITAGDARRKCQQGIEPDPEPGSPAHGISCGKKTNAVKRCLRDNALFVVPPMIEVKPVLRDAIRIASAAREGQRPVDPAIVSKIAVMAEHFGRNHTTGFAEFRTRLFAASGHLENDSSELGMAALEFCLSEALRIAPE
jgi:hypothetical protein